MAFTALALLSALSAGAVAVDAPSRPDRGELGTLTILATDAETGAPVPARARIAPRSPLRDDRVLSERAGKLATRLREGRYRVIVSHGPHWSIVEREIDIEAGGAITVRAALKREVDSARFTACDLHVHSDESPDSNLELQARIDTVLAEDVQFAVLTNHNKVTRAEQEFTRAGLGTLPGLEVTTWAPELGHFNVFPRLTVPKYAGTSASDLVRELRRDERSFVQMNHPRLEGHIGYFALARFDRQTAHSDFPLTFDAMEVWNGYDLAEDARRDEVFLDWLALVARGQHIYATGNSDSHKAGLLPYVGYPRTYVHVPRAEAQRSDKVLAALKHGRAFVSNGPLLELRVYGRGPGETVHLARGVHEVDVEIEAHAPAWMALSEITLWLGDERALTVPADARVKLKLPVGDERSLVATVRGEGSMKPLLGRTGVAPFAFTNPIWLARR
ncbi:MAG TPA: CehA/McbA family metallohydrolase [Polyangiales bacterium]|nr:CehA/McbA family metallohydrolase [Polyangiales bacterium]